MSQSLIRAALNATPSRATQMSYDSWASDQQMRGEKVRLFRDYAAGDHRANLTPEMRRLLRIADKGSLREFNDNYMDVVIQSMADRITVSSIDSDVEAAQQWAEDLLRDERFDAMQADVHEATIRDGDTYVMAYYDNEEGRVRFAHEPAYDGIDGMLVLYDTAMSTTPSLAIKIWHLTLSSDGATMDSTARVNVYYPDRIERYISRSNSATLTAYSDHAEGAVSRWVDRAGKPLGVPVVHFRNRKAMYDAYGQSEIENAVPLQDVLNRMLYSTVMVYELTAFRILIAKGFPAPSALTPGMIVEITDNGGPLPEGVDASLEAIPGADPTPFLSGMQFVVSEIGNVTNTPRLTPQGMGGDSASGESLKQREIGLLGKINRFEVKAGNAWEDLIHLAVAIQTAFGTGAPPAEAEYTTKWVSPEIRNDATAIQTAVTLAQYLDQKTFLELISPIYDWDSDKIAAIIAAKNSERAQAASQQPIPNSATTPAGVKTVSDIYARAGINMNTPPSQTPSLNG